MIPLRQYSVNEVSSFFGRLHSEEDVLYQSTYFIEKSSGTLADNLAAYGLAFVLNGIASGRAVITLRDMGSAFAVISSPAINESWVKECEFFVGVPFLITVDRKSQTKVIKGANVDPATLPVAAEVSVDYDVERENVSQFFDWFRSLSGEEKRQVILGELAGSMKPHPDWDLFRAVNPAGLQAYNSLVAEWWYGRDSFTEMLTILLGMTAVLPNDLIGAEQVWKALCQSNSIPSSTEATASQLFNPAQGKGSFSSKTRWRTPGNIKEFWMLEWLKIVGLRYGGMTRLVQGSKDRKTYALSPVRLHWHVHRDVMLRFERAMAGSASAVKLDIFAALHYTRALLDHYEEARAEDLETELLGAAHGASDLVSGMQMAFYKDMGNAIATMNIAVINLPSWVRPKSRATLASLGQALEEHLQIIRSLDESRGDQFDLLCHYRDFLSAHDLSPFFRFAIAYSGFIIHQYERRRFVRPFTTTTLEVLFMNSDDTQSTFSEIVQDTGFKNVAYAIRHSTVVPQGRKAQGHKPTVEVRYGLGQQLARKAAYPADFLSELAEFIYLYNAENAQLRENNRSPFRRNVTTEDIQNIAVLVDRFGSKVVCNMLVAYGYAREPYEITEQQPEVQTEQLYD